MTLLSTEGSNHRASEPKREEPPDKSSRRTSVFRKSLSATDLAGNSIQEYLRLILFAIWRILQDRCYYRDHKPWGEAIVSDAKPPGSDRSPHDDSTLCTLQHVAWKVAVSNLDSRFDKQNQYGGLNGKKEKRAADRSPPCLLSNH
jgi:hypothetical protein